MTRELRAANDAYDGPAPVTLSWNDPLSKDDSVIHDPGYSADYDHASTHVEHIPGDGARFDAVAAARRLLAGLALALLASACVAPTEEDAPALPGTDVQETMPPNANGCGWPYRGSIVTPPLPAGMRCYYAIVTEPVRSAVAPRTDPRMCMHGERRTDGSSCTVNGCTAIGNVGAGVILDVWGLNSNALMTLVLEPHPTGECVAGGS